MEKLLITGNGPLHGEVVIAGAKNAALPVIAASLLTSDPMQFSNVLAVRDIATVLQLMKIQGCKGDRQETELSIDTSQVHSVRAPYEFVKTMRGSILLLSPLLARFGKAAISLPGGCANIDQNLAGLGAIIRRV
jgi:UDP-N-acetylglucosamine 1-carboxyvinyltransferase